MTASSPFHNHEFSLAALNGDVCRASPREERFDRVTRTLRRLLHVPMALITVLDEGRQMLRSTQGLDTIASLDMLGFCGAAGATGKPVIVPDMQLQPAFASHPLVRGAPGLRSYVGWPLEIAPGVIGGALCALDTIPRQFSDDELAGIRDLARMAECELTAHATDRLHKALLMRMDLVQRRHALDPLTGCWNIRGFRELLGVEVPQAQAYGTQLALCHLRAVDLETTVGAMDEMERTSVLSVLAQLLRERLPADGALARLGETEFCAMVPAPTSGALAQRLAPVLAPEVAGVLPDGRQLEAQVVARVLRLDDLGPGASASRLWAALLADAAPI